MKKCYALFMVLCGFAVLCTAQTVPAFHAGELLTFSDGTVLKPQGDMIWYAVPCVVDWNGDGKRDLLAGYFENGNVYQFINTGSNIQPAFDKGDEEKLQADGTPISVYAN